nr:RNA-directed DNA polymerase, eukaryota [Tanacetum cinerariifolium]
MDNNEENKQGEEDIHLIVLQQPPKEEANNKESNPEYKAESSDLSRTPGFEFMKKSSPSSSKCSTSFARFRKKDIKGVSLIHELNQIIDVGNSFGYDVIDMNVVRNEQERVGSIFNNIEADYFNSFIDATSLVDLLIGGRCFTWMNKASTKLIKLDRFLISEDVIDLLPDIHITALDRIWSDHNPILLHVDKIDFGPSPFKLYNSWLLRDGFDDLIKTEWDSLDSNNFEFSIKCHEKKDAALEELSSIKKKIDKGSASPSDTENRLNLLHELEIIDNFASMDFIQKARVKWDIEVDENTKFFHGLINRKRRNQMINDDVIITTGWNARDLENIIRVFHVFYLASGLKINIHKSNIQCIGINEDEVYNMASNARCIAGNIHFNYLGLPIGSNMKSIASWKIAPESVLNDLERIRSNFFWGGNQDGKKMAWVKWPIILNSYDNGGLNIDSLKAFNLALLQKWRWRLFTSPNDLWVKVVKAFHGHEGGFDNNGCSFKDIWVGEASLSIRTNIGVRNLAFFREMLNEIGQLNIVASEDTCVWNLGPNGTFTVEDARNFIDQKTIPSSSWDKIIPRKNGLAEVPSNDHVFGQWLNALFQKAALLSRLLPRGLFERTSPKVEEMIKKLELTIEARDDVDQARIIVRDNLDDGGILEPYLFEILDNGPFVPLSPLSTPTNPLPKPQNRWSHADRRLANQDKRLKTIEGEKVNGTFTRLNFLLNDLENNGVSIPQAEDSDSDIEEDQRSSSEISTDLNVMFRRIALPTNQRRFYKRSGRDEESMSSNDEWVTTCKALIAIADEELSLGREDARALGGK